MSGTFADRFFESLEEKAGDVPRRIGRREGIGITARVLQARELLVAGLFIEHPCLILVRRGEKRFVSGGFQCRIQSGEAVAVPGGVSFDVINRANEEELYEAVWLVPDRGLIERAEMSGRATLVREPTRLGRLDPPFFEAFDRAVEAIADEALPEAVAELRVREVLVWLAERGHRFDLARSASVAARVRLLVGGNPAHAWTGPEVARALAMSEATLRRRLAAEEQSLSEILIDVRMSYGLSLLQATDRPIAEVAFEVGYQSPSRFAARFRARFGYPPATVRQGVPRIDRIGTEIDRPRSAAETIR